MTLSPPPPLAIGRSSLAGRARRRRASWLLAGALCSPLAMAQGALAVAAVLPFTPAGAALSFTPLAGGVSMAIVGIVAVYLATAYVARRWARPVVA